MSASTPPAPGSEAARIALLASVLGAGPSRGVRVGIGDDAAVLEPPAPPAPLVWTIDVQVEGTHFRRAWLSLEDLGFRSFMAAASDLAAMGATPRGALSALVLPPDFDDDALAALARGQSAAARALATTVVGGNLARGTELSITTTLLGECARPTLRAGAKPGDVVLACGAFGLAGLGLRALEAGKGDDAAFRDAVTAWRRPRALLDAGARAARAGASACIDVSDGLLLDAARLADASAAAIVLDEAKLMGPGSSRFVAAARTLALEPLDLALRGGEDYALVVTLPTRDRAAWPAAFREIGRVTRGAGVSLRRADGTTTTPAPGGFDHFAR